MLKDFGISKQEAWIVLILAVGLLAGFVARPLDEYLFAGDPERLKGAVKKSETQFNKRTAELAQEALTADSLLVSAPAPGGPKRIGVKNSLAKPVDINSAPSAKLIMIPGIGPKTAARIIEYRSKSGPFSEVDDLLRVKGIGKKTLEKIKPFIEIVN